MKRVPSKGPISKERLSKKPREVQTKLLELHPNFAHEPAKAETFGQTIKIMHWNVNSLNSCIEKDAFKDYFEDNTFDVICLNETKLSSEKFQKLKFVEKKYWYNKYYQYWNFSTRKLGYSGVAILTKEKPISVQYDVGAEIFDEEGRCLTLEFPRFYLVSVYVPNAGAKLERLELRTVTWDNALIKHLNVLREKKGVVLVGDMNVAPEKIDLYHSSSNETSAGFTKQERDKFQELMKLGYKDCFRALYPKVVKYSYWSPLSITARKNNIGWRIDHCITDEKAWNYVKDVVIRDDIYGSDHCPIEVILELGNKTM